MSKNSCRRDACAPRGWHSRGYLPHFDVGGFYQAITYRLGDSLPVGVVSSQPKSLSDDEKLARRKLIEQELDCGYGSCILGEDEVAEIVVNAWKFFDGQRYELIAYVVMPNHVHVVIKTYNGYPLDKVIHSWKSFTSHEICKLLKTHPTFKIPEKGIWQKEYYDRFIRDEQHFNSAIEYIYANPVKAGLCEYESEWKWSSYKPGSAGVSPA